MSVTQEGWHTTDDGQKLYTKTWKTTGPPKARVAFIHGFSDHCNTYDNLFPALTANGIEVYAFDQRGWGRSVTKPSERGLTGPTSRVIDDITSFLRTLVPSPLPLFLVGHSMGGGEVLYYASRGPSSIRNHIRGYMLIAPFVDFGRGSKPSSITVFLGRLVGRVLPRRQMVNKLDPKSVSRDPEVQRRFDEDALCHDTGTLEGLSGLIERTLELNSGAVRIGEGAGEGGKTRVWVAHGDEDALTDFQASKRFFEKCIQAEDKEFKAYPGHFHRLHDEPKEFRDVVIQDMVGWILQRAKEPVQEGAGVGAQSKL